MTVGGSSVFHGEMFFHSSDPLSHGVTISQGYEEVGDMHNDDASVRGHIVEAWVVRILDEPQDLQYII